MNAPSLVGYFQHDVSQRFRHTSVPVDRDGEGVVAALAPSVAHRRAPPTTRPGRTAAPGRHAERRGPPWRAADSPPPSWRPPPAERARSPRQQHPVPPQPRRRMVEQRHRPLDVRPRAASEKRAKLLAPPPATAHPVDQPGTTRYSAPCTPATRTRASNGHHGAYRPDAGPRHPGRRTAPTPDESARPGRSRTTPPADQSETPPAPRNRIHTTLTRRSRLSAYGCSAATQPRQRPGAGADPDRNLHRCRHGSRRNRSAAGRAPRRHPARPGRRSRRGREVGLTVARREWVTGHVILTTAACRSPGSRPLSSSIVYRLSVPTSRCPQRARRRVAALRTRR